MARSELPHPAAGAALETGDPATSLRQLLSWSHRQLSPPAAAMFALLRVTAPELAFLRGVVVAGLSAAWGRCKVSQLAGSRRSIWSRVSRGFSRQSSSRNAGRLAVAWKTSPRMGVRQMRA